MFEVNLFKATKEDVFEQIVSFNLSAQNLEIKGLVELLIEKHEFISDRGRLI